MMTFDANSKVGELLDNPAAKTVLVKYVPKLPASPMISMARGMTLKTIAGFPQSNISPETLQSIVDELAKI